jgi:hypothetical protein
MRLKAILQYLGLCVYSTATLVVVAQLGWPLAILILSANAIAASLTVSEVRRDLRRSHAANGR